MSITLSVNHAKLLLSYLLEGAGRPAGQAAGHQVVSQLPEVKQLLSVVVHRSRHQLRLQAHREHRLHLHTILTLDKDEPTKSAQDYHF